MAPGSASAQSTLGGTVTTGGGAPVQGVLLEFTPEGGGGATSTSSASDGSYSVSLATGTYVLHVTPPEASGLVPQSQSGVGVSGDETLDIILVDVSPATFAGILEDSGGAPVAGAQITLSDNSFSYSDTTDEAGAFSIAGTTAAASLQVVCSHYAGCNHFGDQGYNYLYPAPADLTGGSVDDAQLVWPVRTLTGTVSDSEDAPVQGAVVSRNGSYYDETSGQSWNGSASATTDGSGQFSLVVVPGEGTLSAQAPDGSGLENLSQSLDLSVAAGDPAPVALVLQPATLYEGTLEDSEGSPVANAQVTISDDSFSYSGSTDDTGAFSIEASSSATSLQVVCNHYSGCTHFGAQGYNYLYPPPEDLSAGSVSDASLVWPVRSLSGTVTDSDGNPVDGAVVSRNASYYDEVSGRSWNGSSSVATDASGAFSMAVVPGEGTLSVQAPEQSGLENHSSPQTLALASGNPDPVLVVLQPSTAYAGTLEDSNGNPIANAQVTISDDSFSYSGSTDGTGAFAIAASSSAASLQVVCTHYSGCTHFGAQGYNYLYPAAADLSGGSVNDAGLVWPVRSVRVTVSDVDGLPVADSTVSWSGSNYDDTDGTSWNGSASGVTDLVGAIDLVLSPGSGTLTAQPSQASGLTPFALEREIWNDGRVALLVQFVSESTSEVASAGGTVTSDPEADGATPTDPLETAIFTAVAGTVSIEEKPITQTAPLGIRFLTQQISISAPSSTPEAPLEITFTLDASRIPDGEDETTIFVFRNGTQVGDCPGASTADPDPCLKSSQVLVDGDLEFVVLTSAASEWNLGIEQEFEPECAVAADCNDGDECTMETCDPVGLCVRVDLTTPACTGGCAVAADCDDGDDCTLDSCATGACAYTDSSDLACLFPGLFPDDTDGDPGEGTPDAGSGPSGPGPTGFAGDAGVPTAEPPFDGTDVPDLDEEFERPEPPSFACSARGPGGSTHSAAWLLSALALGLLVRRRAGRVG